MEQPKRTAPHRIPCYCHKCDGTLVSVRTERNHRQSARAPDKSVYGRKNKQMLEADEHDPTSDSSSNSSEPSEGPSRVKKKPRIINSGSNDENQSDEEVDLNLQQQVDDDEREEQDRMVEEDVNDDFNDEEMRLQDQNDDNNNAQDITDDSEEENDEGNIDGDPDSEPEDIEQASGGNENDEGDYPESHIENIRLAQSYVNAIKSASLDNDKLSQEDIYRLRNPSTEQVDLDDPDVRLSIDLYMSCGKASESTYKSVRESILKRFPNTEVMSYYRVKALVSDLTGVVSIEDDIVPSPVLIPNNVN
ncbi:hypothetical protein B0H34DRAFT_808494 [Crassisporium funariophilum]|nr:hypothetical protein B0H34DRAFT_808494 [Crassisporium funariophilum]